MRQHICGVSAIFCGSFSLSVIGKGKQQLSSLPAIYFSETHNSQGCILGFIVHFKLGYISQQLYLIGRLLKGMSRFRVFHPENAVHVRPKWGCSSLVSLPCKEPYEEGKRDRASIAWSSPNLSDLENAFTNIAMISSYAVIYLTFFLNHLLFNCK